MKRILLTLACTLGLAPFIALASSPLPTIERNLRIGMSGEDVHQLQLFLNRSPDTQIAVSGAGSPGYETLYFGKATLTAVIKFQEKYTSEILTPNGLSSGTGYVGVSTRTVLNRLVSQY